MRTGFPRHRVRDGRGAPRLRLADGGDNADRACPDTVQRPANRVGSVFVNPGGPGGSGRAVRTERVRRSTSHDNLDGRFDVVGFDPRGVGASDPSSLLRQRGRARRVHRRVPVFPYERGQYRPFYDHCASARRQVSLDDGEVIADHMSTADVVRDLDLLRQAVGDRKLTYLGFSYGSYIGNTYANLFPQNVRALVIDGVLDPRLWSSGWQIESDRVATQGEFDEFLRLCGEAGPAVRVCDRAAHRAALGGARPRREGRANRPRRRVPVHVRPPDRRAAGAMYAPEVWGGPEGFAALPRRCSRTRPSATSRQRERARTVRAALLASCTPALARADYDNGFDAYFGNQCADTEYPAASWSSARSDAYARAGSRFGPFWWWFNNGCADWPVAPDRYVGPVDGPHVGSRPRRRQLLRRRHRLRRGPGQQPAAGEQPPAQLCRLGPYGVRPQRMHNGVHRRVPPRWHAAACRHDLSREPEPLPRSGGQIGNSGCVHSRLAADLAAAPRAVRR